MLPTIIYGLIIGAINGVLWGAVFGMTNGVIIGSVVGLILGILVGLLGKSASLGGNVQRGEVTFVNSSILTMLAVFSIGLGIIAWLVKFIFF